MSESFSFSSRTAKLGLPLLFSGQAQKEFYLNQSLAVIDSLTQLSVEEARSTPPVDAVDGQTYRILPGATDQWAGNDDHIAIRIGGAWHYVTPSNGMQLFDRAEGKFFVFNDTWRSAVVPPATVGGETVDVEARAAISGLVNALQAAGILANPDA